MLPSPTESEGRQNASPQRARTIRPVILRSDAALDSEKCGSIGGKVPVIILDERTLPSGKQRVHLALESTREEEEQLVGWATSVKNGIELLRRSSAEASPDGFYCTSVHTFSPRKIFSPRKVRESLVVHTPDGEVSHRLHAHDASLAVSTAKRRSERASERIRERLSRGSPEGCEAAQDAPQAPKTAQGRRASVADGPKLQKAAAMRARAEVLSAQADALTSTK